MICQNCNREFSDIDHGKTIGYKYSSEYWSKNPVCPHCGFNNDQKPKGGVKNVR